MLFNFQSNKLRKHLLLGSALCAATLGFFSCTPDYNYDEDQPSGLNTIYGYMVDQGNYKNFLQLIDDLGETETLSKTGSKTLFIADDAAFATFYANNKWGVKNYEGLTLTQKKLLLRSAMIDNPYPISMMSSVQGPIEGECMRRTASLQTYDSVLVVSTSDPQIPQTSYWTNLAQTHDTIVLFKDFSGAAPMIHFLPRFLEQNMITGTDVDFLYNDPAGTHVSDDAYVNDCKVVEANIFCKNGFLHKINKVMLPLDNMAEVIRTKPQLGKYSALVERFSAPFYDYTITREYNRIYNTDIDSVYQKAYFAVRGNQSTGMTSTGRKLDKDGNASVAQIKFDPGWNRYQPGTINDNNRDELMEDMGCMLVPTDDAIDDWWNNGGGKVLKDNFGTLDKVPDDVINKLIDNNMLKSFVASVPSKFNAVLNDAAMEMGITTADVDSVFLACNGAVYQTNKVFAPMSYSSVMFPAIVTENMKIIKTAIENLEFEAYLNSMVSRYSFFIPINDGMLTFIDPVTLPQSETHIWKFSYDPKAKTDFAKIRATVYLAERQPDGTWLQGDSLRQIVGSGVSDQIYDRLEDLLDNIIVIGDLEQGKEFYQTKGKNFIKIGGAFNVPGQMTVAGGWQIEQGVPETVTGIYNMENGKSYVINTPLYTAHKSVSDVLIDRDTINGGDGEFSEFLTMLNECNALSTNTNSKVGWSSVSRNGNLIYIPEGTNSGSVNYLLNTYHYTMYIPTNAAMQEAYAKGLPTLDMLDEAMEIDADDSTVVVVAPGDTIFYENITDSAAHLRKVMLDFVKYHIQDNSIFIDNGFDNGNYETAKTNPATGRSFKLTVTTDNTQMTVKGICTPSQPINQSKMYNQMAREYWLNNNNVQSASMLETSSSVVLHAIDHPLLYKYYPEGVSVKETDPETGNVVTKTYPITTHYANQFIYSPNEIYTEVEDEAASKKRK